MSGTARYTTLREYVDVVRRHRLLVIAVTVLFAGAALGYSVLQKPTYEAEASLASRDLVQDLSLLGQQALPATTPDQRAATQADLVTSPEVLTGVKKQLRTPLTAVELGARISAQVEARTNFIVIQASAGNAAFSARLANAVAQQSVRVAADQQRRRLTTTLRTLQRELSESRRALRRNVPGSDIRLSVAEQRLSQLQTLRRVFQPLSVARTATTPAAPSSPRPVRNTLLGALLGLVLGLLAAFVRDSLDRRLRGLSEVQEELGLPVLGRISSSAMGHVALVRNGNEPLSEVDVEAFRMLRTNLEFLDVDKPPRCVVVTSGLPEEGKSTVAASLASAAAASGKRTLLLECDLRRPSLAARLGVSTGPGLSDYLARRSEPQETLQTVELTQPLAPNGRVQSTRLPSRLVCITAGQSSSYPAELLGSQRCQDLLEEVTQVYDLVVLDSSPLLSVVDTLELLPHADAVLMCVRARRTTREEARAAKAALDHFPERPTGVVITGLRDQDEGYGYYYTYYSSVQPEG